MERRVFTAMKGAQAMASGSSSHISLTEARSLAAPQPYQLLCQKQDRFNAAHSCASSHRVRAMVVSRVNLELDRYDNAQSPSLAKGFK